MRVSKPKNEASEQSTVELVSDGLTDQRIESRARATIIACCLAIEVNVVPGFICIKPTYTDQQTNVYSHAANG